MKSSAGRPPGAAWIDAVPECGIAAALGSRQFTGHGHVERVETSAVPVVHLIASRLSDQSHLLGELMVASRDFH